ncbi:iron-siderophore ABC transporter substrate-binding protein [Streptomyces sp. NPDC046215]|uniref:Iron-siderophore ABC transporter substrate-binding protein n=1 Tax=Streptomyces stramineus TaxID=173861 RepID=A0ABN0ZJE4_9ACTN
MSPTSSRRLLTGGALAVTAALALTACGSSDSQDTESKPGDGGTHVVKTAMGDVKVKNRPQRVVVLDTAELDSAITLGVKPVGATRADVASGFLNYLPKDKVDGIQDIGKIGAPNLETIAGLKPDLILGNKVRDAARYKELSKIAPTVMTETTGYPWKDNFTRHAEALGRTAEAQKAVDAYRAHAGQVTEALGGKDKAAAVKVNMVRFVEGADIRIYGRKNYIATVLADAGVGRPAIADQAKDGFSYDVSPEQIDKADTDVIFTSTYGDAEKSKESATTGGTLWKNMRAVKDGKVFKVDDQLWIQGIGYTAAHKILDELKADLTK